MAIKSDLLSLDKLFSGRLYEVPDYQRAYRWETKQRIDLFNDIKNSMDENREHLMSTIVVLKTKTTTIRAKEYQVVDIVDGQQRITTLIILYRAIINELDENNPDEKEMKADLERMLIMTNDATTLLQTNHDTENHFSDYIRHGKYKATDPPETSAEKNLINAIRECENFVREYKSNRKSLPDLVNHINNRVFFVYQELQDEALTYYVFEGLNNRGRAVSKFDLLKTNLMQMLFKNKDRRTINEVHNRWSGIYRSIGTSDLESDILKFTATLYQNAKRPLSEEKAREFLLCESKGGGAKAILETVGRLEAVAKALYEIENDKPDSAACPEQPTKYVLVAIKLQDDLSDDKKHDLCDLCLKIGFIMFRVCWYPQSKNFLKEFLELACDIVNKKISAQEIESRLRTIARQFHDEGYEGHDVYEMIKESVKDEWDIPQIHYLLYKYEEYLTNKAGNVFDSKNLNLILEKGATETIEHILPRSSEKLYVHWPGNLFLLSPGKNSKLGKKKPQEKRDEYYGTGFKMANDIIPHLSKWNQKSVIKRGEKIFKWVCEEWDRCKSG